LHRSPQAEKRWQGTGVMVAVWRSFNDLYAAIVVIYAIDIMEQPFFVVAPLVPRP
jgi:hypothetical protein